IVRRRTADHQAALGQPAHHDRYGALMGQRALGQLVDRRRVAAGELVEHEELCAADAEPCLRGPCREAQRSDDAPERIHHRAHVRAVVCQGTMPVESSHWSPPHAVLYWSQYIAARHGVNRLAADGMSPGWCPRSHANGQEEPCTTRPVHWTRSSA